MERQQVALRCHRNGDRASAARAEVGDEPPARAASV